MCPDCGSPWWQWTPWREEDLITCNSCGHTRPAETPLDRDQDQAS